MIRSKRSKCGKKPLPVLAVSMLNDLMLKVRLLGFLLPGILMTGLPGIGAGFPGTGMDKPGMDLPGTEEIVSLDGKLHNEQHGKLQMELQVEPQSPAANRANEEPGHVQRVVTLTKYLDSYYFLAAIHQATGDIYLFHAAEFDLYRLSPKGALKHITTISETGSGTELSDKSGPLPKLQLMDIPPNGSDVYLWYHGLGPMYRYSIVDDIVEPIFDRKIDKIMYGQAFSIDFEGNLYVAGGYGLWQFHNLILTANKQSEDWQNIESLNKNVVPNGLHGNTYTNQHYIYYLVRDVDTPGDVKPLGMYRLNRKEKIWTHLTGFRERLQQMVNPDDIDIYQFSMSTTAYHHEDEGIIYVPYWLEDKLNLLEWNVETDEMLIYHLDSLGLSGKPGLFRPGFTTSWTGVSLSSTDSLSTDITMVSFDLENWPSVTVVPQKQSDGLSPYLFLLPVLFLLSAAYVLRQKRSKLGQHASKKIPVLTTADPSDAPDVSVSTDELDVTSVHVSTEGRSNVTLSRIGDEIILKHNEVRIPLTQTLEVRFWGLILDSLKLGISSIPFETLDDTIMPYEHQKATKSRTRKKLLELASSYAGTDAFRVQRSKKDRRKKVLIINPSKFTLS